MSSLIRSLMVKVGADLSGFKSNMADAAKAMKDGFGSMDLTQTNNAIKGLSQSVKLTESEFKAATAGMDDWRTNVDGLKARTTYLNDSLDDQKVILDGLNNKLGLTKSEYGENSDKANRLKIEINNQTAKFKENEAELVKVTSKLDNFGKETANASSKSSLLGDIFKGGFFANLASNALSAIGNKLQEFATAALDSADELMKLKSVTGKSTEELQQLKYVGDDLGVSLDTIAGAQKKLTKSMGNAQKGTKLNVEAFKKLKVEYQNADGSLRDVNTVMYEAFEALKKHTNETERDALAMEIFGKSATELNPLIEAGSDTLKSLSEQAKKTGAVMSDDAVEALDSFGDSMDHVKQSAQTFVGETLANIIGGGETAAESMEGLEKSLSETSGTLSLIDKYKSLNEELKNASNSEEQVKQKTEELESVKQQLITASKGLITAIDLENGTFDKQVAVFKKATKSEKEYLNYQLESVATGYVGLSLDEKRKKATDDYTKSKENYQKALDKVAIAQENANKKDTSHNRVAEYWSDRLDEANAGLVTAEKNVTKVTDAMAQLEKGAIAGESAVKQLVDNGFMTADEACKKFAISADDLNRILRDTTSASGTTAETQATLQASLESTQTAIDDLTTKYNEAYIAAGNSIDSQIGWFSNLDIESGKSIKNIIKGMQEQIDFMAAYSDNLKTAVKRGVDEGLVQQLSDGSTKSAIILATLSKATDAEIANINTSFGKVSTGKGTMQTIMKDVQTNFGIEMAGLVATANTTTAELDMYDKMVTSGKNTAQGYIDGISMYLKPLQNAGTFIGNSVINALDYRMRNGSPSKEMKEKGKYADEGFAIGIKSYSSLAADEMAQVVEAVKAAAQVDLGSPSIGKLSANNNSNLLDMSNEMSNPTSTIYPVSENSVNNERKLTVGGEITVNGVNNQGEFIGSTKLLAQELLRDSRRFPIG